MLLKLKNWLKSLKIKPVSLLLFGILLMIFIANSLYASYPDEFDNILGGKFILHGSLPYVGFFSHHGPLAYFLSAILVLIGGVSFVHFRILSAFFFTGLFIFFYYCYRRVLHRFSPLGYWIFAFLTSVAAIYFWGQMFLADPLSGYLLIPAYLIVFYKLYFEERFNTFELLVVSLSTFFSVINSMTYAYAGLALYTVMAIYFLKSEGLFGGQIFRVNNLLKIIKFVLIFALPYALFLLYLLVTRSVGDFIYDAVNYNQRYYIYNYPRAPGVTTINPIRYAIVIFNDFFNNFHQAVSGILSFNPRFPMTHTLVLTDLVLLAWLAYRRKVLLAVFVLVILVYVNARGNPAEIKVTDYQTSVYFILSILNFGLLVEIFRSEFNHIKDAVPRVLFGILAVGVIVYWFFGAMFIFSENWRVTYDRYMGYFPLVYDRPLVAPIVNTITTPDDYCWVGPFEFEEMLYLRCKLPSKYDWILPQFGGIDLIKQRIIADYTKNSAPVIVFRRDYSAFGASSDFNGFFVSFLDHNYVRLKEIPGWKNYHFRSAKLKDFHPDDDFNFRKDVAVDLAQKLAAADYITSSK